MALLWLSCPHCQVLFHIDDANAGRQVACRACGNPIRIPGVRPKEAVWYYTRDRKSLGPVPFAQRAELARTGNLAPEELVWQVGWRLGPKRQAETGASRRPLAWRQPRPALSRNRMGTAARGGSGWR